MTQTRKTIPLLDRAYDDNDAYLNEFISRVHSFGAVGSASQSSDWI